MSLVRFSNVKQKFARWRKIVRDNVCCVCGHSRQSQTPSYFDSDLASIILSEVNNSAIQSFNMGLCVNQVPSLWII